MERTQSIPQGDQGSGSSAPRPTGATVLVDHLIRAGARTIFGVPGDTGVGFYDALSRRGEELKHVLARDERHAAFMADAYARATGGVGVVEVSSGGGTTFAVGGLGEAFAASVPVVVITTDIQTASRGTGALTEIDQRALFSAVTKAQYLVDSVDEIPGAVATAFAEAASGRPAPVALILPEDVLDAHPTADLIPLTVDSSAAPTADADSLREAARLLSSAERPAILVGGGVHASEAYSALEALATALGAGVATSIHGKGAIADAHPFALGVAGNNGGTSGVNAFLAEADVALLIGTRANATDTDGYTAPSRSARIIAIDIDPGRAGRNYPGAVRLVGDAGAVLNELRSLVEPVDPERLAQRERSIAGARAISRPEPSVILPEGTLLARDVVQQLRQLTPDDAILVVDPGTPTPNASQYWTVRQAGRSMVVPRGHGPMGYAIPAAIGAAFARPGSPIIALTADGSFAMACGELETAARFGLPIIFVQLTNNSLGWIKMLQHLYMDKRYFGVTPGPIDAVGVAKASGMDAIRVTSLDELREAVTQALRGGKPLYIDVQVPHVIDEVPPVPAWHRALDGDNQRPAY